MAVALATLALLLQWGYDWVVRAAIAAAALAASIYIVVRACRGHGYPADPTVGLPADLRRWLLGESKRS